MRKALKMLLFVYISICYPQSDEEENKIEQYQKEWTIRAEENIRNWQLDKAFISYGFVKNIDSLTEKGIIASRRVDSLQIILRNKLKSGIHGTWKWRYSGSNWGISERDTDLDVEKTLIISGDSLSFYETDKSTKLVNHIKTEILTFNNIPGTLPSFWELVYSDNQIWSFHLKNEGRVLHLTNTGEIIENNHRTEIVCGNLELTFERIK